VLLVSPTLVLQQHPSALDALFQLLLQSPTALNAAQITRILALLAQLVLVILLVLPPHAPLKPLSSAASLVLQVLPHALNASQDMFQMLLVPHAPLLEQLPTAFSTVMLVPLSLAPYATQVSSYPVLPLALHAQPSPPALLASNAL